MATYDLPDVYVAVIDTAYRIVGVGETASQARKAACKAYRRQYRNRNSDAKIIDYWGVNVYGPMRFGEGVTE